MANGITQIIEVKTRAQRKEFLRYPLRLYKNNPYFVPPLYGDEKTIFSKKNIYSRTCDSAFFLAVRDGKTVGRIQGIIQKQYNENHNTRQVRFTRFDCENDLKTARLLFQAVEDWGKQQGMEEIVGPLGYSDLEREGLLIEGFDWLCTFEEQYNYDYYPALVDACGFEKDVDWVEYRLFPVFHERKKLEEYAARALERNKVHRAGQELSKRAFIKKYKDGIFECIDECYKELYGTVPFTPEMVKQMVAQFKLILNKDHIAVYCDEDEKVVAFGLCITGIGKALQKSGGRLTLPALIRLLRCLKKPQSIDLGLVGILPRYRRSGLNAAIIMGLQDILRDSGVDYLETNLNLETNISVQGQWKYFDHIQHKRRRSYIKKMQK